MWARTSPGCARSLCQRVRLGRWMGARSAAFVFARVLDYLCRAEAPIAGDLPMCVVELERLVRVGCFTVECVDAEAGAVSRMPSIV